MKRSYSLKKNKEFNYVFRAGKSSGGHFAVLIVARARHNSIRVGFSVSKKVGNAVTRNLVKRRMREAFRQHLPALKPGFSLVFVARPSAAQENFQSIQIGMKKLLNKAKLFREDDAAIQTAQRPAASLGKGLTL